MKIGVVVALLAAGAHANVSYWCSGNGKCDNAKGVGPTYECGKKIFGNYDKGRGRWWEFAMKTNPDFWTVGTGFLDCCHQGGKAGCYDIS